ncbi:MAG: phosphatase PAP2 family protein [Atopostipes suicloacalis]|nr:phosphatase PAP2 family protein [Atopostipes suicloacalis]
MYHYSSRKKDNIRKNKFLLTALISIIPFILILITTLFGWEKITQIDYQLSRYFYSWHQPTLNSIMTLITHMGDAITQSLVTIITVIFLFIMKKWRSGLWYGLTVLLGALLLNGAVKEFYERARPSEIEPLVEIGGYSFPSGHSMGAAIVYGGILFLIFRFLRSSRLKAFFSVTIITIILLIGFSRIYLAVHFPSDVIGGFSLGLSWLTLSITILGIKYTNRELGINSRYSIKNL